MSVPVADELAAAVAESFLSRLRPDALAPLLEGAHRIEVPAGSRICPPDARAEIRLVVSGLVRIGIVAADGRTISQRYLRRGDVGGIPAYFYGSTGGGACHALLDSTYYQFRAETWRETAQRDARVAVALLDEVSRILIVSVSHLADEALASMRQRVARQLLDIAADRQQGRELIAPVTQQQLADGIGTVREVVARALKELRDRGAIATGTRGIVILDAQALRTELDVAA